MSTLFEAINSSATTDNGAVTNLSSLNNNLDLFFLAGASRGKDIKNVFAAALAEDKEVALRILQWTRDARGGSGERKTFKDLFSYLISVDQDSASKILAKVPELGRYDDLFVAFGTSLEREALRIIASALTKDKNGLCAKWCPRNGLIANKIRAYLKLSPKDYRKLVVGLTKVVEQQMCSNDWTNIEYSHVPSVAAGRYQKAFAKHDPAGYAEYKQKLTTGETKINASVAYPYDVIRSLKNGDRIASIEQWKALPNYLERSSENIIPVVDVSGSMTSCVSGSVTAQDVAISLGLYVSERMGGIFKDHFFTFSSSPKMQKVSGDLGTRYDSMVRADWGMSTDLGAVFKLILSSAVRHNVPQSEMPTKILILSDMQFNQCITGATSVNAMEFIKTEYTNAGYEVPQVVFWNLMGKQGNSPVTYNETGTALISGFSPSIVKSILGGEDMTPLAIMLKTIMIQRYDIQ